ncbi:hypothetical protein Cpha266_0067 [Chlorobium phaeobacteroides DSM 266]|uniref:Uncharacterized protein n=1 Tax=Chlorobium phaeobacteroides (strain DSM 266 / SMG 266 / 2430) TaxID=290317 RepID=A1BCL0_CHLPD|nr:hypothetical protein Cpha266_0067 [Chlorobium phaeobacteroides DSM 266]
MRTRLRNCTISDIVLVCRSIFTSCQKSCELYSFSRDLNTSLFQKALIIEAAGNFKGLFCLLCVKSRCFPAVLVIKKAFSVSLQFVKKVWLAERLHQQQG